MPKAGKRAVPTSRGRSVRRSSGGSSPWWRTALDFLGSAIWWRLILVVATVYGVYWLFRQTFDIGVGLANGMFRAMGFGIFIVAIAVGAVVWLVMRGFSPFLRNWNRWLGAGFFLLVIWGMLGLFDGGRGLLAQTSFGGQIGRAILGDNGFVAALRLVGLTLVGFLFITPGGTVRALAAAGKRVGAAVQRVWRFFRYRRARKWTIERLPGAAGGLPAMPPHTEVEEPSPATVTAALPGPGEGRAPKALDAPQGGAGQIEKMWQRLAAKTVLTPSGWQLPPMNILEKGTDKVVGHSADNSKRAKAIEDALASYGVDARVIEINVGPAVTQFGIEPGWDRKMKDIKERDEDGHVVVRQEEVSRTRVKVERIASLANDLALALAAPTIRIEAPVPGKSVVGIEVPNTTTGTVTLRSVIETASFQKVKARSLLAISLGKGAGGESVAADLSKMPHLLIAGATGSGKTVMLNAIITCLLMHNTPEDCQFIMVDPKRVELVSFNTIPHLVAPVVVDTEKSVDVLRWLLQEMDRRYLLFSQVSARNIEDYNKKRASDPIPYLVLVIDELADLMMTASDEVERSLCRLAQLARATGIHLVVATQRPSVDVVTGLIKANFPTRISFAVTSQVDSRTILDSGGAEKLLGKGDMLYMATDAAKPRRLQGCFISDQEIERLVYFWNSQNGPAAPLKVQEFTVAAGAAGEGRPEDPLLVAARRLAQEHRHISASFLQRRLHIGFSRAAHLMNLLENEQTADQDDSDFDSGRLG
ncbi:MAG TPA: DNA translocase FtsK [Dehalococcoidia bacterium]|nr:DNA translocase FtsK [Dehalococcoidia bacterium]